MHKTAIYESSEVKTRNRDTRLSPGEIVTIFLIYPCAQSKIVTLFPKTINPFSTKTYILPTQPHKPLYLFPFLKTLILQI